MQLNVVCNLSYATTQICSYMCCMQLNFSYKRQLQNPKFLVVVRDVTLMNDESPTLAHVFTLFEKIKLNMVEERVVTSRFNRDTTITFRGQQSTSQPCSGGGGNCGGQGRPQLGSERTGAQRPLPSFVGQQQGQSCWTCGGAHI